MDEQLQKSIDSLIDQLFSEDVVEKSNMIKDQKPQKETADEAVSAAPKSEKDEKRDAGRPKQIADVPQTDTDGARSGAYDGDIAAKHEDGKKKEDSQVEVPSQMKKSFELTAEEFEEYKALKKSEKKARKEEDLRKAREETADLVKSAVDAALAAKSAETEALRKSLDETSALVKSMANKPQKSKAVTGVVALEKFQKSQSQALSKADVMDIAEGLMKSHPGEVLMEHVIEIEQTGNVFDPKVRALIERTAARRQG